ncbi:MAG: hypothetical protein M3N41_12960 [Acidobacteriota bacterium]|nr:hypothetical protein [Acidobacteriota bacterium]
MHILSSDVILLAHATFGVTGCQAALWVFVEALNAGLANRGRIRTAALLTAVAIAAAWICGGFWYVHYYPPEKALILGGPWPFAHNLFMETKEHLFFVTAILAFLLPIAAREDADSNAAARQLVLALSGLILITGLTVEGAGAVINHGVKVALLPQRDALFPQVSKGAPSWIPGPAAKLHN